MQFDKIHNLAQPDPVNHIADDARHQQRQRNVQPRLVSRGAPEITEHEQSGDERNGGQYPPNFEPAVGEQAERHPAVGRITQSEEPRNDLDIGDRLERNRRPSRGQLIDYEHDRGAQQISRFGSHYSQQIQSLTSSIIDSPREKSPDIHCQTSRKRNRPSGKISGVDRHFPVINSPAEFKCWYRMSRRSPSSTLAISEPKIIAPPR